MSFLPPLEDPRYFSITDAQRTLFDSRRSAFAGELALYDERIKELRREIIGTREQKTAAEQLAMAKTRAEQIAAIGTVVVARQVGDEGKLFGSVGPAEDRRPIFNRLRLDRARYI